MQLLDFIAASPTAFHAADVCARQLREAGFLPLDEGERWQLEPGRGYFVTRNSASLIAFRAPRGDFTGFMISAAHTDSPAFAVTDDLPGGPYARLAAERYGGMNLATWLDRPLSIAGRVLLRRGGGAVERLVDLKEPVALIPSVAIHLNKNTNTNAAYDPAVDMIPLLGMEGDSLRGLLAQAVDGEEILSHDLFLYNPQSGLVWNGFVSAPRLDDLQCVHAALTAFLAAEAGAGLPVLALFDSEEVGSETAQGAGSTFLSDVLSRLGHALGLADDDCRSKLSRSLLVSCDNAHGLHPNHPELSHKTLAPVLNRGLVIKRSAARRYTTDALSESLFALLCDKAGVPVQRYANRPDLPGGATLGHVALGQVSVPAVDVGLPQLAMHSAFETAGAADSAALIAALTLFFASGLTREGDGFTFV